MKKNYGALACIICAMMLLTIPGAEAQRKLSFEIKPAVNFPTQKLGNADLKTGFGIEGSFAYRFIPQLAAYAGWGWNKFSAEESFAGDDVDFEETGYHLGLQFMNPISSSNISYIIRGGATYKHIETENSSGKIINDTGHGFGWQAGAGLTIPVGKRWQLIPELQYHSLSRDIASGDATTPVDLKYISAGLGFSYSF